ncbi:MULTISPECIES: hypothetical protein [Sinorhizobium]|uniref:hypothetical protein n=1 Tax=Sinorhizobium TaxID=28105 RepID=UPI0024B13563|nr:hypothetical protein [Sinorhizobium terangae]WFU51881.1 hypothetical protein QA637_28615 [Sinorhizobium terangae]
MTHDDDILSFAERDLKRARQRRLWALVTALKIYSVLGAVFAVLAASYFILLFYNIELTDDQVRALLFVGAGVTVSVASAWAAWLVKRRGQGDYLLPPNYSTASEADFVARNVATAERVSGNGDRSYLVDETVELRRLYPAHHAMYFVHRWARFEEICRDVVRPYVEDRRISVGKVLEVLGKQHLLGERDLLLARECLTVRNDIVHNIHQRGRSLQELDALSDILNDLTVKISRHVGA